MGTAEDVCRKDLKIIRGYPMVYAFALGWEKIEEFQSRPCDIVIPTYPKSGESCVLNNPGLICPSFSFFCLTSFFYSYVCVVVCMWETCTCMSGHRSEMNPIFRAGMGTGVGTC